MLPFKIILTGGLCMAIYGYVRISTSNQNIDRQVYNILRAYPDAKIISEVYSGRYINRQEWNRLMNKIKSGDTIIFDEVSRMSRSSEDGIEVYQELFNKGVELIFIKEPHISTTTYRSALNNSISLTGTSADFIIEGINKYLMALAKEQIRLAFEKAEQEVNFIRERTKEGLRQAKANGVVLGRAVGTTVESKKGKKSKTIIAKHSKTFGGSLSDSEVMQLCGCSRKSYYKYKKQVAESFEKAS